MKTMETVNGVMVIGSGRWGKNHVRNLAEMGLLNAIVEKNETVRNELKKKYPAVNFYSTVGEALNNNGAASVVIATPAEDHYQTAKTVIEKNRDVLIEKPMALSSTQARELVSLAHERKRILMVGHLLLYHPAIRKIKNLIENGTLGKLQYIYSNRLNLGAVRQEENILWSFAPHDISVLHYLIGSDPIDIKTSGAIILQPGIHDVTITSLEYPNNVYAHVHVSWLHPFKEHRLVVIGNKSMVVFEDTDSKNNLLLYPKGIDWVNGSPQKRDGDFQVLAYDHDEPLKLELQHFSDCVRTRKQPLTDGLSGVKVLEILEKAQTQLSNNSSTVNGRPWESPAKDFFVHETSQVDAGCSIGSGTKIWHFSHIQKGAVIGKKCSLGQNVNVGNNVVIGNFVKIQNNVSVYEGVELEDYVFCGPSMVFTNVLDPRCEFPQRGSEYYRKTLVKYGATIGANATIVCGNTLGRFAFIGAGAVVTKDVPDHALVVGNPARIVGWMCRCGHKLAFTGNVAVCARCSRRYYKEGDSLVCETDEKVNMASST